MPPGFCRQWPEAILAGLWFRGKFEMTAHTRRRLFCLTLLAVTATVLSACGQKGPLYLPEEESKEKKKKQKSTVLGRPRFPRA